ncbi:hypothetical protein GFK26_18135 [Variovorax paradoxus]|uniref:Uncharacterized protein n=1 Tax=Variovorax paradoxus TaxID=34073 RepID=A0A5Q0M5T5_VARPD|nr:hypothetical protein [Variovorax paradoxus]QFZ84548.1 hypothetical protein GFK26_18135 [Variovorax paradoxus]
MKFLALFLLVAIVVTGLGNRSVRNEVFGIVRFYWPAIVIGVICVFVAFVLAYSGEAIRLF